MQKLDTPKIITDMDFELAEEHQMVREMTRGFVEKEVKPVAPGMDRAGSYPSQLVKRLSEMGLMGILVPQEFGGSGMDLLSCVVAMEEISKAWASLGVAMSVQNSLVCAPILRFGSAAQKKKYLPSLASGKQVGCDALTGPGAGSDAGSIQTSAKKVADGFVLNGNKIFTTNGNRADLAISYAVFCLKKEITLMSLTCRDS